MTLIKGDIVSVLQLSFESLRSIDVIIFPVGLANKTGCLLDRAGFLQTYIYRLYKMISVQTNGGRAELCERSWGGDGRFL